MEKLLFWILGAAVICTLGYGIYVTDPVVQIKQNPDAQLVCEFRDGVRVVPKDKIVAYDDERDVWAFTNGSAHNCWIERSSN
jgi:hypothetical protein